MATQKLFNLTLCFILQLSVGKNVFMQDLSVYCFAMIHFLQWSDIPGGLARTRGILLCVCVCLLFWRSCKVPICNHKQNIVTQPSVEVCKWGRHEEENRNQRLKVKLIVKLIKHRNSNQLCSLKMLIQDLWSQKEKGFSWLCRIEGKGVNANASGSKNTLL